MPGRRGATLIILLVIMTVMAIGLMAAVPLWRTQVQREKEEELIFRGRQVIEAVRLYLARHPGRYPSSLEELHEKRCLRRLYEDPMTPSGEWDLILLPGAAGPGAAGGGGRLLVVPQGRLASVQAPRLVGVASSSTAKSFRVYNQAASYDEWLFYHGQDPKQKPQVIRLVGSGEEE
jgi:type II secretory pathway pseudopilin PulG